MNQPQVYAMAHLRPAPAPKCHVCNRTATKSLYTGLNDLVDHYCASHAGPALSAFKART